MRNALGLDRGLIHQHDGDIVLYRVDAMALRALQALGILPVLQRLLARRANQNFQQVLSNHDEHCTPKRRPIGNAAMEKSQTASLSGAV